MSCPRLAYWEDAPLTTGQMLKLPGLVVNLRIVYPGILLFVLHGISNPGLNSHKWRTNMTTDCLHMPICSDGTAPTNNLVGQFHWSLDAKPAYVSQR